jgi:hypothetical protein
MAHIRTQRCRAIFLVDDPTVNHIHFVNPPGRRHLGEVSEMTRAKREPYYVSTRPFVCDGEKQVVQVKEFRQAVQRCRWPSRKVIEETVWPVTSLGCYIHGIEPSPSGNWLVTQRISGQGDWGYDVFRTRPLARVAGVAQERGYILELPRFSADESWLVGGFGIDWLGGWWIADGDDWDSPARGGLVSFGFLFVHRLPSQRMTRHELRVDLPKGWLPDDPESEVWYGASNIEPLGKGVRLTFAGGVPVEIGGPLASVIRLPTPHPAGGKLL